MVQHYRSLSATAAEQRGSPCPAGYLPFHGNIDSCISKHTASLLPSSGIFDQLFLSHHVAILADHGLELENDPAFWSGESLAKTFWHALPLAHSSSDKDLPLRLVGPLSTSNPTFFSLTNCLGHLIIITGQNLLKLTTLKQ